MNLLAELKTTIRLMHYWELGIDQAPDLLEKRIRIQELEKVKADYLDLMTRINRQARDQARKDRLKELAGT